MTDVVLVKQAVEQGKVSELEEWMAEVRRREDEAVETLRDEGVYTESAFLERTDDWAYLLYYMEAEDIEQVWAAFEDSSHEIDAEHEAVMRDVLVDGEDVGDFELLYHLTNRER